MFGSARLVALRALLLTGLLCVLACGDGGSGGSGVDDPTRFRVAFGGAGDERAAQVHALDDGYLVVATRTAEEGAGAGAVWLLRTDARARVRWSKTLDADLLERPVASALRGDGSVALLVEVSRAGTAAVPTVLGQRLVVVDGEGVSERELWFRTEELLSDLAAAGGGDLLGVGREGRVLRLRPDGLERWSVMLSDASGGVVLSRIVEAGDGDLVVGGASLVYEGLLARLDAEGLERWSTVFPRAEGSAVRPPVDLVERSDGVLSSIARYIVDAIRSRDSSPLLLEVEAGGAPRTERIERSLALGEFVLPVALAAPRDGGLILANHGERSGILRLGADGEERWGRVLAEGLVTDLAATSDGGFVAVGSTEPYRFDADGRPTPSDVFLLRADVDGTIDSRWLVTDER